MGSSDKETAPRRPPSPGTWPTETKGETVDTETVPRNPLEGKTSRHEPRTATCVGCGERFRHRELVEVTEDHESLTWFPGDLLCIAECAGNHGVL